MTEQELIRRLREARPAPPAGFEERQAKLLLSLTQKEEKPIMKRKMSAALVFAVVLVLLSVSAFAASLVFSPRADAGKLANRALLEKYGITDKMMTLFYRETTENADGTATVVYSPADHIFILWNDILGSYTVIVKDGKAQASWSHDGEEITDGLESKVWGATQLEKLITEYGPTMEYLLDTYGDPIPQTPPTPFPSEAEIQEIHDREAREAQERARLSLEQCKQIALDAIIAEYGLTLEQQKELHFVEGDVMNGMLLTMWNGQPVSRMEYQRGHADGWQEKDGIYVVFVNVENGQVEDMIYDSALAGNG